MALTRKPRVGDVLVNDKGRRYAVIGFDDRAGEICKVQDLANKWLMTIEERG